MIEAENTEERQADQDLRDIASSDPIMFQINALAKDNQTLTSSLVNERHEKARLLSAVSRLQGENAALRETLAAAHAMSDEVAHLASTLERHNLRFDELGENLQRLIDTSRSAGHPEGANEAAEHLHLILTSRTWRAMRPIRGLGRIVKRLRDYRV